MVLILGGWGWGTDYSATIRIWHQFLVQSRNALNTSLWCSCPRSSVAHYMILWGARPNMPSQTTGLLTALAHSFEGEMWPGPIFQQLVRLSVVQGGKLGRKTVVTFSIALIFFSSDLQDGSLGCQNETRWVGWLSASSHYEYGQKRCTSAADNKWKLVYWWNFATWWTCSG